METNSLQHAIKRWRYDLTPEAFAKVMSAIAKESTPWEAAVAFLKQANEAKPNDPLILRILGGALLEHGNAEEAMVYYERMFDVAQDDRTYREAYADAILQLGFWREAWALYETIPGFNKDNPAFPKFPWPVWDGTEPLAGARALVVTSQGFGDAIMMARYVEWLKHHGCIPTLLVYPKLERLFKRTIPETVIDLPDDAEFDCVVYLQDLLMHLSLTPETVYNTGAYLTADPLVPPPPEINPMLINVGLCWGGNPNQSNDPNRSILGIEVLRPLLDNPMLVCHSLQVGKRANEAVALGMKVAEFSDYAETADFIQHLDIVVTVDTSIAHLAGAMGKPCYVMLCKQPDWRYYPYGDVCCWYPEKMRLFVQSAYQDWAGVIRRINAKLGG